MRFILFVEGHTEDKTLPKFFKKWLDPRLPDPVGIRTVRFEGWPDLVKEGPLKARMHLNGPSKDNIIAVISLLDLYGPTFYPESAVNSRERWDWGKAYMESCVNHPGFFQFFAVHEVEAWLLSQPDIFPVKVQKALPKQAKRPETVNFNEPPSKLLGRLYAAHMKKSYKKLVNGKALFDRLDPDIARRDCPRLKELLDKMLELAKEFQLKGNHSQAL